MSDRMTFAEWLDERAARFVELSLKAPEEHREDFMRVQARSLSAEAVRFSRAGLRDEDFMPAEHDPSPVNLSFSEDELLLINNALNEICNGNHSIDEWEFHSLIGAERSAALSILDRLRVALPRS